MIHLRIIFIRGILLICFSQTLAEEISALSGELFGLLGPGRFRVTGEITVPSGKNLILRPGTVLLFDGFFSLTVFGRLEAEGSSSNPIVFTSIRDQRFGGSGAEALDWNHLDIMLSASALLDNCGLLFSSDGLVCKNDKVVLRNVFVGKSGANRVAVSGRFLVPRRNGIFEYPEEESQLLKKVVSDTTAKTQIPLQKQTSEAHPAFLKWGLIGGTVLMASFGVWYFLRAPEAAEERQPALIADPPNPPDIP
ncbi:MAG: hypothetical protein A2293_00070 [Elusimicrobia bacterium RIFOXYB2_FULL_49_7]|nr:MAG: hypothetical protein A2293_00070 [Elusimicrobia bacterium RIFOXYB2_FULL_49_7]